ncbi:anthrone oxygenase family protein [Paracoccus halophilus]|nr:anthrone oxygenase family protein [Paracoccus halophilus]
MAGFFFAFSVAVMPGMQTFSDAEGMTTIRTLSRLADSPVYGLGLWGGLVLAVLAAVLALMSRCEGWQPLFTGCMLYLLGVVVISLVGNMPGNGELVTTLASPGRGTWLNDLGNWSLLNQLRTGISLLAAAFVLIPLLRMPMNYWRVAG